MEQSPSSEANLFSVSQEIPRILWNPKFHSRFHKCPPPVPILSHIDPVHAPTSHFLMIHLNIILTSYAWVFQVVSFPQVSPPKPCIHLYSFPYCYMPRPSHSSQFYHPNNIGCGVQIIQLHIMYFSPLPYYLVPLMPKHSPQHPILKHPQPAFLSQCEWPSFTLIQNNRQNYISVYLNL